MVSPQWDQFESADSYKRKLGYQDQPEQQMEQEEKQELPEQKAVEWGDFQTPDTYQGPIDPTADEDTLGYLARNMLSVQSRGAETIAGTPGNMEKFGKDVLSNFPQTGGLLGYAISKLVGPQRWEQLVRGPPGEQQKLPTSKNLRETTKAATKGYLEPKTPKEAILNEFAEDVAGTVLSRQIPGMRPITSVLINNLGIPAASNAVKQIVSGLGFGEDKATGAKLATNLFLTLLSNVNSARYASDLMNEGRNGMPNNVQFNVGRYEQRLQQVENQLLNADPRSALARQEIGALREDIARGNVTTRSLMDSYDGVNAAKRSRGLFDLGNRADQRAARRSIDLVRNAVRDEILESGAAHPEALENWRNGIQSWAVIHQSRQITNYIEDVAKGPYAKILAGPAATLFGVGAWAGSKIPLVSGTLTAGAPALYKGGQVAYRMFQDPRLANYYWQALGAVAEKDLPTFLNNYGKLNKGLEKKLAVPTSKKKGGKS